MRWDYDKPPDPKSIVVTGPASCTCTSPRRSSSPRPFKLDKLALGLLLGRGKLADEFRIAKATRTDLTGGTALELVPKQADPRFDRIFFVVDPKTSAVTQSLVVDLDGSENHMAFTAVKTNQGLGAEAFHFEPPAGTQIISST